MNRCVAFVVVVAILLGVGFKKAVTPIAFKKDKNGHIHLGSEILFPPLISLVNFVMDPFKRHLLPIDETTIRKLALAQGDNLEQFIGDEIMDVELFRHHLAFADANYDFVGRIATRNFVANGLAMQWRLSQLIRSHPEILEEKIEAPLVLIGQPRSGTTYLQRVLADAGLGLRFPTFWEACGGPVPMKALRPEDVGSERDPRMVEAKAQMENIRYSPAASVLHEWHGLFEPEEELVWMMHSCTCAASNTLGSQSLLIRMLQADPHLKYRLLKRILQVVQWENWVRTGKRPRWLLKAPEHLMSLDALVANFQDVKLVAITRDSMSAFKSLLLLQYHFNALAFSAGPVEVIVNSTKAQICRGIEGFNVLPNVQADKMIVTFEQSTRDTEATVERIARFAGLEWGPYAEAKLKQGIERRRNLHMQKPRFTYDMDDFGLTDTAIRDMLARCPEELRELRASDPCDVS